MGLILVMGKKSGSRLQGVCTSPSREFATWVQTQLASTRDRDQPFLPTTK